MSNSHNDDINNTDDTIVYIPRKVINKLTIENGAKEKVMNEKMNILQDALKKKNTELIKLKEEKPKEKRKLLNLDEEHDILNDIKLNNNNVYSIPPSQPYKPVKLSDVENKQNENKNDSSTSSIFVKKNVNFKGGNKKHTTPDESDESTDEEDETDDETDSETSSNESSSSDVYTTNYDTVNTDDGYNKAYNKINKEMDIVAKTQKGGKIKSKDVVKRINFLLDAIKILDNSKRKSRRK